MSESRGSYVGVMIFAVVLGILAIWQLRGANLIETIVAVASIVFCLGLLLRQKWALIGICLSLLVGICVLFIQTWFEPIIEEDLSLMWPHLIKMIVAVLLFIYIGRERINQLFS